MSNERKSVVITLSIIIVLSGLITLGIALTITMISLFIISVIETKRQMSETQTIEDIMWRNDIL